MLSFKLSYKLSYKLSHLRQAGMRLDQLFLHWRCPGQAEYEDIIPDQDDRPSHASSSSHTSSASSALLFIIINMSLILFITWGNVLSKQ